MTSPTPAAPGTEADRLTVLVADDHPMVADVIANACAARSSLEVIGVATTGTEAFHRCHALQPDVLVLDLGMPGMDGFEIVRRLSEEGRTTKVLVVTGYESPKILLCCMRRGVEGVKEKSSRIEDIAAAVEDVARGSFVFSEEQRRCVQPLLAELTRRSRDAAMVASALTKRERQILNLMVRGHSNKQCAHALGITERTVESHLFGLFSKLNATSRIAAAQRALDLNLVDLTDSDPTAVGVSA